jgi:hypothetical protein
MWTVIVGVVEVPRMLTTHNALSETCYFNNVGPTMGEYQSPNKHIFSLPAVLWHFTTDGLTMAPRHIAICNYLYAGPL